MTYAASIAEDNNTGSLREVKLAMARWLAAFNPLTFTSPYDWEAMDFLPESASCKDGSKTDEHGTVYTYSLVFTFNKQNAALYNTFIKYLGQVGIVQFTDNNGLSRIIGRPQEPVTIAHDADTGQQYSSLNYYKVSVSWESCLPAVVV